MTTGFPAIGVRSRARIHMGLSERRAATAFTSVVTNFSASTRASEFKASRHLQQKRQRPPHERSQRESRNEHSDECPSRYTPSIRRPAVQFACDLSRDDGTLCGLRVESK